MAKLDLVGGWLRPDIQGANEMESKYNKECKLVANYVKEDCFETTEKTSGIRVNCYFAGNSNGTG